MLKYDKNGNEVELATLSDVDTKIKNRTERYIRIDTIADLDNAMLNYAMSMNITNYVPVVISGITIPAWTKWFFPFGTQGDNVGFAMYPDASRFYIIGRSNNTWFVTQIK